MPSDPTTYVALQATVTGPESRPQITQAESLNDALIVINTSAKPSTSAKPAHGNQVVGGGQESPEAERNTQIIAASIAGAVGLALCVMAVWFVWRWWGRRKAGLSGFRYEDHAPPEELYVPGEQAENRTPVESFDGVDEPQQNGNRRVSSRWSKFFETTSDEQQQSGDRRISS